MPPLQGSLRGDEFEHAPEEIDFLLCTESASSSSTSMMSTCFAFPGLRPSPINNLGRMRGVTCGGECVPSSEWFTVSVWPKTPAKNLSIRLIVSWCFAWRWRAATASFQSESLDCFKALRSEEMACWCRLIAATPLTIELMSMRWPGVMFARGFAV